MTAPPTAEHPSDDDLRRFAAGEVGEHLAVHLAEHLDACPTCVARVEAADPILRSALSGAGPLPVPPDLVPGLLARIVPTPPEPAREVHWHLVMAGVGLIGLAGLAALLGDPTAELALLQGILGAMAVLLRRISTPTVLAALGGTLMVGLVVLHRLRATGLPRAWGGSR